MNKTIQRLQIEHNQKISTASSETINSSYHDERNDYDDIDDFDVTPSESVQQDKIDEKEEDLAHLERAHQRKRSIDALDLHTVQALQNLMTNTSRRLPSSQMNKLRRSFDQFHRKISDDMEISENSMQSNETIHRRHSHIERFRHKFLKYYNEKSVERKASSSLVKRPVTRSWSTSDTEFYALANHNPCLHELETTLSRTSSMNSACDKEIIHFLEKSTKQHDSPDHWTLHDIINNMDIFAVTLTRESGKELGLELAHVTQTGSPVDKPSDVMYVYHNRHGNAAIVDSPKSIISGSMSPNIDYKNDVDDIFGDAASDHNHNRSPNSLISGDDLQDKSSESTSPRSNERRSPLGLYGMLDGNVLKPSNGVRVVDIAKGSIADQAQKLQKDDVIVEVCISDTSTSCTSTDHHFVARQIAIVDHAIHIDFAENLSCCVASFNS